MHNGLDSWDHTVCQPLCRFWGTTKWKAASIPALTELMGRESSRSGQWIVISTLIEGIQLRWEHTQGHLTEAERISEDFSREWCQGLKGEEEYSSRPRSLEEERAGSKGKIKSPAFLHSSINVYQGPLWAKHQECSSEQARCLQRVHGK